MTQILAFEKRMFPISVRWSKISNLIQIFNRSYISAFGQIHLSQVWVGQKTQSWVSMWLNFLCIAKYHVSQVQRGQKLKFELNFQCDSIFCVLPNFIFLQVCGSQKSQIWVRIFNAILCFAKFHLLQVCSGQKPQIWVKISTSLNFLHFAKFQVLQIRDGQ